MCHSECRVARVFSTKARLFRSISFSSNTMASMLLMLLSCTLSMAS